MKYAVAMDSVALLSMRGNGSVDCIPPFGVRQRLCKHVTAANTRNNRIAGRVIFCTIRSLMKGEFWGLPLYLAVVVRPLLSKNVPAAMNCWRRSFLCGPCRMKEKFAISSQKFMFKLHE
jgi:hypothetical protein